MIRCLLLPSEKSNLFLSDLTYDVKPQSSGDQVDLLEAVGLFGNLGNFSVHHHGVVLRPGPHSASPAAYFMSSVPEENPQRQLKLAFKSDQLLWSLLSRSELAMMASVKQWQGNSGTLLSLYSGSTRYF